MTRPRLKTNDRVRILAGPRKDRTGTVVSLYQEFGCWGIYLDPSVPDTDEYPIWWVNRRYLELI
jgi:hypothetical protein